MNEDKDERYRAVLDISDVLERLSDGLVELEVGLSYRDAESIMMWHLQHGVRSWLEDPPS